MFQYIVIIFHDIEVLGMLEIDKFLAATSKNLEGLSWYEIISKLGLLSFNSQGNKPIELIAKLARITDASTVLIVGCGAGYCRALGRDYRGNGVWN